MTMIATGDRVPRDGTYTHPLTKQKHEFKAGDVFPAGEAPDTNEWTGQDGKPIRLEKGQPFPSVTWDVHELRAGDVVPKDGLWLRMPGGEHFELHAGDTFPPNEDAADDAKVDFVWARKLA